MRHTNTRTQHAIQQFIVHPAKWYPASFLHESPPPLTGGGWGVGEVANSIKNGTFPLSLSLPRR